MKKTLRAGLAVIMSFAIVIAFTPLSFETSASSKLAAPKNISAVADKSENTVSLDWDDVSGAKAYKVYQKKGNSYKAIATVTDSEYVADGLKTSTTYTFCVRAAKSENGKYLGNTSACVKANIGASYDPDEVLKTSAEKLFESSESAEQYAEEIATQLAYNPEYWTSNEGWRTAGSDAEHKAAEYLKQQWEEIGLEDVTLDKVKVDKFQFNDARLTVSKEGFESVDLGTDLEVEEETKSVISYSVSGTKQRIEKENLESDFYSKGLEIVYMGKGTKDNYEAYYDLLGLEGDERTMEGKIVLVGVDQYNEVWITQSYNEAYTQGAEGVVSYQETAIDSSTGEPYSWGTYGSYDNDTNHVQDICSKDLGIPCVGISKNNALAMINMMPEVKESESNIVSWKDYITDSVGNEPEEGTVQDELTFPVSNLYVDSEVVVDGGYTYNVVGKISGKSNTGQRLIYAGHYDKYFYGFEDDCLAVGLTAGIAKAMIDSGYEPENDIYFIAHGSEEWGQSDTDFDWAVGSYGEITKVHPEWQGSTLALFNFEQPGIEGNQYIISSYETKSIASNILDSGIYDNAGLTHTYTPYVSDHGFVVADTIGYEESGVPCYMNWSATGSSWQIKRYHTNRDDISYYRTDKSDDGDFSSTLMLDQIKVYGGLGMTYDKTPAEVLDLSARCDVLEDAMTDDTEATAAQKKNYENSLKKLKAATAKNEKEGNAINAKYKKACLAGDVSQIKALKKKAIEYNKKSLAAFKTLQKGTVAIEIGSLETKVAHTIPQENYDLLESGISYLESDDYGTYFKYVYALWGPEFTGEGGFAQLNGWFNYCYATFCSEETLTTLQKTFTNDYDNWGICLELKGKLSQEWLSTYKLNQYINSGFEEYSDTDYLSEFTAHAKNTKALVRAYVDKETKAMNKAASIL